MSNLERMTRFLNDVQGIFMQYAWPYTLPKVTRGLDENDEPCDRLIDAHWQESGFEFLLTLDDGEFQFYGDNYGEGKVRHGDASPQEVAEALHGLMVSGEGGK